MNEERKLQRKSKRHGFLFGIVAGGAAGALLAGALVSAAPAMAARAWMSGHGQHEAADPEGRLERARFAAGFVLSRVDATEAQKADVDRIVADALGALGPFWVEHRDNRDALHDELSRPEIDADAIERLRREEMAVADAVSREVAAALTAVAQSLTPEQRAELLDMGERFHH